MKPPLARRSPFASPEHAFKHGVGRVVPVPLGGTEGWSTSANMQPTVDPVRKTYVATPEDEFKHGYGEREPAPMGGSQSWVHPR